MKQLRILIIAISILMSTKLTAQVGDYRNTFSVGVSGGYVLNSMNFTPTVTQGMHGGMTFGVTGRYTSEKYFSTLCAIQLEANVATLGWKQDIMTISNEPVNNPNTGVAEQYERSITYIQIPMFAHLSWGKEKRGVCGFINLGPQLGFMLSESTTKNYDTPYMGGNDGRVSPIVAQESMPVKNKLDYGIAGGAGIEADIKHVGRFSLEARYYYGLGNIYGDSKRDYFGTSNHSSIFIKMGYMFDL